MIQQGVRHPTADARRIRASHAYHYLAIFDRHSDIPLYLGRSRRTASVGQRIMLPSIDRSSFPRCTVPGYQCEVDHIDEWANGGLTNIDTLTFDCAPHHKLHTSGGWKVCKSADGRTEWIPPPQLDPPPATNDFHHSERLMPHEE